MTNQQNQSKEINKALEKYKKQIQLALPSNMDAGRMKRIVMTELSKNERLQECSITSVCAAVIQCAQLGLEPGELLGHAYLIPYKKECQFQLGYRGMIELARRSGEIISICAQVVMENDLFEFEFGIHDDLRHVPAKTNRGDIVAAYAVAKLKGGGYQFDVMWRDEVDSIRDLSKSAKMDFSPWHTNYAEMAKKTVIRRIFKYLPISI